MAAVFPSKEPTLEDVAPIAARQRGEAKRQLPIDILLTLVSGGTAPITRGQAGRAITKGALEHVATAFGGTRKKALDWARKHLRGLATVPEEHLDPIEKFIVERVNRGVVGQFGITGAGKPAVLLNPLAKSSVTTVPHEIVHSLQYSPMSPKIKRMIKPAMEQLKRRRGGQLLSKPGALDPGDYGTMIERHAREGTRRILREAVSGGKKIPRSLGKKRTEEIFEASLKAVLESSGWVP